MNAKKIMGAVLVALLAAALFVGAGAADAYSDVNGKTVFVGQVVDPALGGSTWTNGDNKVTFTDGGYITGKVVEGKYVYNDTVSIKVFYPTVLITAVAEQDDVEYNLEGATYYKHASILFNISSPAGGNITDLLITNPDGSKIKFSEIYIPYFNDEEGENYDVETAYLGMWDDEKDTDFKNGTGSLFVNGENAFDKRLINKLFPVNGEYKIQGIFGKNGFAPGILITDLIGKDVFTFNVADESDVTITASVDTILQGKRFSVTITGQPGETYYLSFEGDGEVEPYSGISSGVNYFTMPNTGSFTIYLTAKEDGEVEIGVGDDNTGADADVTVEITPGEFTAAAEKDAYFIGEDIKLSGINTLGGDEDPLFYMKGTNTDLLPVEASKYKVENGEWSATIEGDEIRKNKLDAGTYTIYITTNTSGDFDTLAELKDADEPYATASVNLKQPFISVTKAPAVVVQGEDAKIEGIAEAAKNLSIYIFGTNKFAYQQYDQQGDNEDIEIKLNKDNTFVITIDKELTEQLDAGQYFAVIQHPMYDGLLNIYAIHEPSGTQSGGYTDAIYYTPTVDGEYYWYYEELLFDVADRQKANAAQALCDELDGQKLDDMYVKLSFIVAAGTSSINPIPTEIVKGEKLTVSGQTNGGEGTLVTVDMLSTAFAAVPKETVGSASFISLTTKTDENGNWEVTFDTTGLNIDEYTVTAAVEGFDSSSTVKVNVIEGADTPDTPDTPDVPDTPDTPDEPTEPETPGFGALAALAGLGAVAVLLLRRE